MKFTFMSKTTQKLLVLTGIFSMGVFVVPPALANNHEDMTQSPTEMENEDMMQSPTDMENEDMMQSPTDMENEDMMQSPTEMENEDMMDQTSTEAGNIVEVASGNESFNTLVQAIEAAGLGDTLSDSSASYTVFAPTDEAFNQLPEGTLEYLLRPENQEVLQRVLSYHVLPQEVTSSEISSGEVETLDGGLIVEVDEDRVIVNNASVVTPDIEASNGVIHAVNRVLLPGDLQRTLATELGIEESELYQ